MVKAGQLVASMTMWQALFRQMPLEEHQNAVKRIFAAMTLRGRGLMVPHTCVGAAANALLSKREADGAAGPIVALQAPAASARGKKREAPR